MRKNLAGNHCGNNQGLQARVIKVMSELGLDSIGDLG